MSRPAAAISLLFALFLTACGSDSPPGAETSPDVTSSPTESPTSSPTESPTESPIPSESTTTAGPSPEGADTYGGFEPTSGPEITGSVSAINAPVGWYDQPINDANGGTTAGPDGDTSYNLLLNDKPVVGAPSELNVLVRQAKQFGNFGKDVTRLPDIQIADTTGFHLAGPGTVFGGQLDQLGFYNEGQEIQIVITTPADLAQTERDQLVGTIMASYRAK